MIIDLGSGPWPKPDADVHVDIMAFPHVEVVHDLLKVPYPFSSGCATKVYLNDVIEHISWFDVQRVLTECFRLLDKGGVLDITCPDVHWIAERIVKGDWKERANGDWLYRYGSDFVNAMSYLFGGFYHSQECMQPGMGHIAGYDEETLVSTVGRVAPWSEVKRVADPRNECILKVLATK
jgi:predicted SAM-dependent methyltransferase